MNPTLAACAGVWEGSILPALADYVRIPNVSEAYEPGWREAGHMMRAAEALERWCRGRGIEGMSVELLTHPRRSPLLLVEVDARGTPRTDTVVLYGHLDKQPEMTGWREPYAPWEPVVEDGRLYGRGAADDGYAVFASLTAIEVAQREGRPHARCVVIIEASEESGSTDLPAWLEEISPRLGVPSLVICLDSGCLDYERMWVTTSLRGLVDGVLRVEVLTEGVHSGDASGVVPSSFRIARLLLDRVEDPATGRILLAALDAPVPPVRAAEAAATAAEFGEPVSTQFPFVEGTQPVTPDAAGQLLNRTWRATLSVTGADGLPPTSRAGNVLRPSTALRLSFRLPPTCDSARALAEVTRVLTTDVPHSARVTFDDSHAADGWDAAEHEPWLAGALRDASREVFGAEARAFGEGGSIPFIAMLARRWPGAQFVVTGVLGPGANAHGPNEFLHLGMATGLTAAMSLVLSAHAERN